MKKYLFFLFCMVSSSILSQNYADYFTNEALRIDFFFFGNYKTTQVSVARLKKEPQFAGSHLHLIYPQYGNFRLSVTDTKTKKELFAKGFSPIFKEWQSTPQARLTTRVFENVIHIPFPKSEITVTLSERKFDGTYQSLFIQNIHPNDYHIIDEKTQSYPMTVLQKHFIAEKAVDLAIVAEGYTIEQMPKFRADARRLIDYLFQVEPFKSYQKYFNVYAIESPSMQSGTDIPGMGIYKNTILNASFYTFDTERYLTTQSLFNLADIVAQVPYDQVYVLVNSDQYGGGGFYNVMNLVTADNTLSKEVFVHEFGHGFVGLADEYYDDAGGTENFYNLTIEPWEPNITTLKNFESKWKNFISTNIPIPTPRTEKYINKVGVFQGGGYSSKGIYSPVQDCRMKTNNPDDFCPVCRYHIEKTIKQMIAK